MADTGDTFIAELKMMDSVTILVEETASLSQDDQEKEYNLSAQDSMCNEDVIKNAIETGNLGAVREWLVIRPMGDDGRKAELNTLKYEDYFGHNCTVLHLAAQSNEVDIVKMLLDEGADPNKKDTNDWNALHTVCGLTSDVDITEMVKLLIERECNVDEGDKNHTTPLHQAVQNNHTEAVNMLLVGGADPNKKRLSNGRNALHIACRASADAEIMSLLIERIHNIDEGDENQTTPLHISANRNNHEAVRILLENGADVRVRDKWGDQPIHWAKRDSNNEVIQALIETNADCLSWKSRQEEIVTGDVQAVTDWLATLPQGDERKIELNRVKYKYMNSAWGEVTALHLAARFNQVAIAKKLLDEGADPNRKTSNHGANALHLSCSASSDFDVTEMVKLLIERNCEVNRLNSRQKTPLYYAASTGRKEVVKMLVKHGAFDLNAFDIALRHRYEDVLKQLINTPQWPSLMRRIIIICGKETTPFREMIEKFPAVAKEILTKCTVNDPDYPTIDSEEYSVAFNYEFIEDIRDKKARNDAATNRNKDEQNGGCDYNSVISRPEHHCSTSWGPEGFKKENHPLSIMVQNERLNLLTHPLVGSLLHHKWNKFGLLWYIVNLMTYCLFLIFLTTFALIIENPRSETCSMVFFNASDSDSERDCGISTVRLSFLYISAVVVLLMCLFRLVLEVVQFKIQLIHYLTDWNNWLETALYFCSVVFVWVFHNDCLCPLTWQWQIGVVAVFLGWINLIVFISKFPSLGIYVLMFISIIITFLKTLFLTILLVVSFGLTFYLTFTQGEILRSPFSSPARSLFKIVSMTTGELDLDAIFRQDPAGGSDDSDKIPFPPIAFMLWIVFIILMPVLLTNMLVGLAVGDINDVRKEAELKKLKLQVEQVLTVEEFLPRKLRRHYICGYKKVKPNKEISWPRQKLIEFQFFIWGGERYDTRASISKVLYPKKNSVDDKIEKMQSKYDDVLHQVQDLKTSVDDMKKLLVQVVNSKLESDETK